VSQALSLLDAGPFDAVVSDVNMPDGGGFELLEAMRARGVRVPVIIMTGKPAATLSKRAESAGAWRAVLKPVMPATLRDLIESIVAERSNARVAAY
jgi:DNA-binding NtrC family response regulator